jgi:hypothetical protein
VQLTRGDDGGLDAMTLSPKVNTLRSAAGGRAEGPEPCKRPGDGSANAARATGHDEHLVVQREITICTAPCNA